MKLLMAMLLMCISSMAHAEKSNLICGSADLKRTGGIRIFISGSDETGVDFVMSRNGIILQKLIGSFFKESGDEMRARPINLTLYRYDETNPDRDMQEVGFIRTDLIGGQRTGFLIIGKREVEILCALPVRN